MNSPGPKPSTPSPLILLVGHCSPDGMMLKTVVERAVPGCRVERVNDESELKRGQDVAALLLINRILDGEFDSASGLELIRRYTQQSGPNQARTMLISNFDSAQEEAEAAGARPGFGKSTAYAPGTPGRIRDALARTPPQAVP